MNAWRAPPRCGGGAGRGHHHGSGQTGLPGQARAAGRVGSDADEGAHTVTRTDGEAGAGAVARADQQGRILTVPNAISVARLAGVPVFLWLVLGPQADGWAVALLIVAGLSDWLDGVIARRSEEHTS